MKGSAMHAFKHILLYHSGEKGASGTFGKCVSLAAAHGARLTIIDVIEPIPFFASTILPSRLQAKLRKVQENEKKNRLNRLVNSAIKRGLTASAIVLYGKPFVEIIRTVLRNDCDLLVKTARGQSRFKETLFGSTALHLMRKCPCPVWVVKPTRSKRVYRILAAVNPAPEDPEITSVNNKIMNVAIAIAKAQGSQLHVLHAWRPYGIGLLQGGLARMPKKELSNLVNSFERTQRKRLDEFMESFPLGELKHEIHFLRGDPGPLILGLARRKRVSLVAMGTVSRTGLPGYLIGNTAEEVLNQVSCSVLTVKPDNFRTPVKVD
jgi:universal stress protein E